MVLLVREFLERQESFESKFRKILAKKFILPAMMPLKFFFHEPLPALCSSRRRRLRIKFERLSFSPSLSRPTCVETTKR